MYNQLPTSIVPRTGFLPNFPELNYTNPHWKLSWWDGRSPGLAQHRVCPLQFLHQAVRAWQWSSLQDIHHCPKYLGNDLCGYMNIVQQEGQGFHFPALSFIRVWFRPECKGQLVSEGQMGQKVWPHQGNPLQMRGLTFWVDTPLCGAVISASAGVPALITASVGIPALITASMGIPVLITTSVGVPALGAGPALALLFGGTLLLFALIFLISPSQCPIESDPYWSPPPCSFWLHTQLCLTTPYRGPADSFWTYLSDGRGQPASTGKHSPECFVPGWAGYPEAAPVAGTSLTTMPSQLGWGTKAKTMPLLWSFWCLYSALC